MFGFKNTQEALAIMLLCQGENMHPAVAMRDYHVIQGRPALKADAMLARFQQAGGSVQWKDYTDEKVTGSFSHPAGGTLDVSWTLAQAKAIGIASKDNWKNYPRAMLRARVISEGIRSVFPGCVVGVYTPEEVQDFEPPKDKFMGNVQRVEDVQEVEVVEVVEDGGFPLYVPSSDQPYKRFTSKQEWIDGYADLVSRIISSQKFSVAQKDEKLVALAECNQSVTDNFNSMEKIKLRGSIVEAGGTVSPKPDKSHPEADSHLNEPIF
jgi:hypothetical protein